MTKRMVSVIVPVYNCEEYVEESLKSILQQDFDDYEVIVYNDGSTDHSVGVVGEALAKYHDGKENYAHWILEKNKGVFKARAEAIRMSKGKYIALHDADDISLSYRLKTQVDFLEEHKDVWCVGSIAGKINEKNQDLGFMDYPPKKYVDIYNMLVNYGRNPMIDSSTMFRKEIFDKLGGYSLKDDRCLVDDFDLWARAILQGYRFYNFRQVLIRYRVNPKGNTRLHKQKMIEQHKVVWKDFKKGNSILLEKLQKIFYKHKKQWNRETMHLSSAQQIVENKHYQAIIKMGMPVVSIILKDMQKEPDWWFWALTEITGEELVGEDIRGDFNKMVGVWLRWGEEKGYL